MTLKQATRQELISDFNEDANGTLFEPIKEFLLELASDLEHGATILTIDDKIYDRMRHTADVKELHCLALVQWDLTFRLTANWPYENENEKEGK